MDSNNDLNSVCSVSEMAGTLGLSRARFYQCLKTGVFPMPVYCIRTRRPFYSLDMQTRCMEIRRTGIGFNGQPVLFNKTRQKDNSPSQIDRKYKELASMLKGMGLKVTPVKVKDALAVLYPHGLANGSDEALVMRDIFRYFSKDCNNGV